MLTLKHRKYLSLSVWAAMMAMLFTVVVTMPAQAAEPAPSLRLSGNPWLDQGQAYLVQEGPRQIFRDDLTVEEGEVIEDDVFVYSGDVEIDEGARIEGDLVVFSGNVEIDEGASIEGDLTSYSGNVAVAGHIAGDLAAMNGNVDLESTARVDGDISVVSGEINRSEGAVVSGNIVQGPSFRFPGGAAPAAPDAPRERGVSSANESRSFFGGIFDFIARLFMAALMTAFVMLLVGGLFYLRPQIITDTRKVLGEQMALSAVVGVLANLTGLFLVFLLAITICLLPLALVPLLLLLAVNIVGWAVASQIVGERITQAVNQTVQPALTILVGAFVLTGIVALLWALGGCFRFVAFLVIFGVSSFGAGAALVPWINRRRGFGGAGSSDDDGGVPPVPPSPSGPTGGYGETVERDVAAPLDYVTAEEINASGQTSGASARRGTPATGTEITPTEPASTESTSLESNTVNLGGAAMVEEDVAQPLDYVTAEEVNTTQEQQPKPRGRGKRGTDETTSESPASAEASGVDSEEETVEQDVAQPIDYVTAQEVITTETVTEGDDFLQIRGVGPTYARRLKDAGFDTFAQLAEASPEDVAAAMGWPVNRVLRSEVIDQAKVLAKG